MTTDSRPGYTAQTVHSYTISTDAASPFYNDKVYQTQYNGESNKQAVYLFVDRVISGHGTNYQVTNTTDAYVEYEFGSGKKFITGVEFKTWRLITFDLLIEYLDESTNNYVEITTVNVVSAAIQTVYPAIEFAYGVETSRISFKFITTSPTIDLDYIKVLGNHEKPETISFTSTQLQTMATLFTQIPDQGLAHYNYSSTTDPNLKAKSFEGLTMTHAFSSIDGAHITPIAADTQYTVVAVGEQDGEYVAGYANKVEGSTEGWELLVRDTADSPFPNTFMYNASSADLNVGTLSDTSYSRLGDLKDETGDFSNENLKTNDTYLFRIHVYTTQNGTVDPNSSELSNSEGAYIQWTQTYNPINTTQTGITTTDLSDFIHDGFRTDRPLQLGGTSDERNFHVLRQSGDTRHVLVCGPNVHYIQIGRTSSATEFYYNVNSTEYMVELYVWKGAKPSDLSVPVTATIIPDVLTTSTLTWTPSASNNDISKTAIDDYSISESNVLTINSGYAVSTSPFDNVWVFAVVADASASNNDFTTTEIQTMVTTHITNGTTEGTDYHKYTNVSLQSFDSETLTNAFSSIDGNATEAFTADTQYTVVAVGEQAGEYVAGSQIRLV